MSTLKTLYYLTTIAGLTIAEAVRQTVPGADPKFWRKALANYDPEAKPKRKRRSRPARRQYRASNVLGRSTFFIQQTNQIKATADLVQRVNDSDEPETDAILVNGCAHFTVMEIER